MTAAARITFVHASAEVHEATPGRASRSSFPATASASTATTTTSNAESLYAELGDDEALRWVAVVDSDLTGIDEPVHFSPELEHRSDVDKRFYIAREAALLGLSLTYERVARPRRARQQPGLRRRSSAGREPRHAEPRRGARLRPLS